MDAGRNHDEPNDPDYETLQVDRLGEINQSLHREDARDLAVQKIQKIVHEQFSFEIEIKEKEVTTIHHRVHETRSQLDRLRACILAGYYGYGKSNRHVRKSKCTKESKRASKATSKEACLNEVMKWKQSLPSNLKGHSVDEKLLNTITSDVGGLRTTVEHRRTQHESLVGQQLSTHSCSSTLLQPGFPSSSNLCDLKESKMSCLAGESGSRFYVKRRVVVGNTSKYILPEHREESDRSTHKWMVYVRGPKDSSELSHFISKVWFLLHPSYQPNDLVEVSKPPFQVTRRGWGEFPVRVQLHFIENKNKRVDIIHHLKLDKTYTGLQTLGAETHVDIELDRRNFDDKNGPSLTSEANLLPHTKKTACTDTVDCKERKAADLDCLNLDLRCKFTHHGLSDHSYHMPVRDQDSGFCDVDAKYPTPPTSVPGSRCSTPGVAHENLILTPTSESEADLKKSIKQFPIVKPDYRMSLSPYCSGTVHQFLSWNTGKRLAAEWQRSLAVKNHFQAQRSGPAVSTKHIMNYCRLHGYTPMKKSELAEKESICKVCSEAQSVEDCGDTSCVHEHCVLDLECEILGSCSSADKFLEVTAASDALSVRQDVLPREIAEDCDVDVVTITAEQSGRHTSCSSLLFLPMDDELEWVQRTAAQVGVNLQGAIIEGVRAPVTAAMLSKACGLLAEEILRKANSFTWKTPSKIPKTMCILPVHVKKALEVTPHCDFLTNKYLGVAARECDDV